MTYAVSNKRRDTRNFNILVDLTYTDGTNSYTETIGAVDLTDAVIGEQARKRIKNVLEVGDAALVAITEGGDLVPPPDPADDPKQQAILAAQKVFQAKLRDAQIKALNDPAVDAAYADVQAAEAAVVQDVAVLANP